MRRPKLRIPMLLTIAMALVWSADSLIPNRIGQMLAQAVTLVLAIGALYSAVDLLSYVIIDRRRLWIDANQAGSLAHAEALERVAKLLLIMTPEQLAAYGRQRVEIEIIASNVCPIYTLVLPFCRVPFEFLELFFSHGTRTHLAPIRRYGEGSKHREFAEAITAYLVGEGYAIPAEGNQPATWRGPQGRADGLKSLGYEEE